MLKGSFLLTLLTAFSPFLYAGGGSAPECGGRPILTCDSEVNNNSFEIHTFSCDGDTEYSYDIRLKVREEGDGSSSEEYLIYNVDLLYNTFQISSSKTRKAYTIEGLGFDSVLVEFFLEDAGTSHISVVSKAEPQTKVFEEEVTCKENEY